MTKPMIEAGIGQLTRETLYLSGGLAATQEVKA
jgi:hypothetical protein